MNKTLYDKISFFDEIKKRHFWILYVDFFNSLQKGSLLFILAQTEFLVLTIFEKRSVFEFILFVHNAAL